MSCDNPNTPKYLIYFSGKKIFPEKKFKNNQYLYRTGFKERENPIEFPFSATAISVSWSNLILRRHVLKIIPETLGNNLYYSKIKELRKCRVEQFCNEGEYSGPHLIIPVIKHSPIPCNYAHSEILMKHFYHENNEMRTTIIEYEDWGKSLFKKFKKGPRKEFFKILELDYRAEIATILNKDCKELDIPFYLNILPKYLILRISFFFSVLISRLNIK